MTNRINFRRVLQGGIIAGLMLNLIDLPNSALIGGPLINEFLLAHDMQPNPLVSFYFLPLHFFYGIIIVWTYACFLPQFGKGGKNALYASLLLLITTRCTSFGFVVIGLLPLPLFLILSCTMVLGAMLGGWMGCRYYSREQE